MCQDCNVLHEKMKEQNNELWALRKQNKRLRSELKRERKTKQSLVKEKKQLEKRAYKSYHEYV